MSVDWEQIEENFAENLHAAALHELGGRPIVIIGFMGAGKTTVGNLLARRLEREFFDSDPYVEQVSGRTIESFFACGEEAAFRELEAGCIRELVAGPPSVIALGGGAFLRVSTQELLLAKTLVVHLHVSWPVVKSYLPEIAHTRPLLRGRTLGQVQELYLTRQATYRKAHLRVSGRRTGPGPVVERLVASLGLALPSSSAPGDSPGPH
jgi:shikimate kinase